MALNERVWNGYIVGWIRDAAASGRTIFQDATNDESLQITGGPTRYPDVLLFLDRVSGQIFNGWELKFPDVAVDDPEMLRNAALKARQLRANSFVTWNGAAAVIWQMPPAATNDQGEIDIQQLVRLKEYPVESGIRTRADLADRNSYLRHEPRLKARLLDILHDLEQLHAGGSIRPAINIAEDVVGAITDISRRLIPSFTVSLRDTIATNDSFRNSYNRWKILEKATLKILGTSSRRVVTIVPEQVLAKFIYYKLIGKILFYKTLVENLSGRLPRMSITATPSVKEQLEAYFAQARQIDYQAVFEPDFTDVVPYSTDTDQALRDLLEILDAYDFRFLPSQVIGTILENLVPRQEKQQFGQYFTPELLSLFVSMAVLRNRTWTVMDPTSGTGSFLSAFYRIFQFLGLTGHDQILSQIWGNDISHFPALLSVINLYKHDVTRENNFPKVTRRDYFALRPGVTVSYPDPVRAGEFVDVPIPTFDAIVSNFPFIQQEDIDNDSLYQLFNAEFQSTQNAFLEDGEFFINQRGDYFTYCFYHSLKFLRTGGFLVGITSNAWLSKNYGLQFKKFMLDNFSIRMIVKSTAEHWFTDSKVSTIFTVLQKNIDQQKTRFVTLKSKLPDLFPDNNSALNHMADLFNEIEHCEVAGNTSWRRDPRYPNVYHKADGIVTVSLVDRAHLINQISTEENWSVNFIAQDPLSIFADQMINPYPSLFDVGRGTRANSDQFQVLTQETVEQEGLEMDFLLPAIKSSREIQAIHHTAPTTHFLFSCLTPVDGLNDFPRTRSWIGQFANAVNKKGIPYPKAYERHRPFWYSLRPEAPANIFITIGINDRFFFSYSDTPVYLNQRLVAIRTTDGTDVELISALLNSIVTLLIVEFLGISRSLGVLDLNADSFKSRLKIFDPSRLTTAQKTEILTRFRVISRRPVESIFAELQRTDRKDFDAAILRAYGFNPDEILPSLYELLANTVRDRIELKDR
jgi:type I restriction-modification system DNA methylase subunit